MFLLNPISRWILYLVNHFSLYFKYPGKYLFTDYMSFCHKCIFGRYVSIGRFSNLFDVSVDDFSYISSNTIINNSKIGKFCSIGSGVKIGLGIHPTNDFVSTHPIFYSVRKQSQISFSNTSLFEETSNIIIGNDVWIGVNVVILDGVTIGDGAIISAGAVVNKDVPPYAIYGGVPAKLIRNRFSQDEIDFLLKLEWWNKDLNWLKTNALNFTNIKTLISNINNSPNAN
jgi:acetyltransferase-like isoleucine patch superfamily enzyme